MSHKCFFTDTVISLRQGGIVMVNPGSGPVDGATLDHARLNMKVFLQESPAKNLKMRRYAKADREGRFGFRVYQKGRRRPIEVGMPGLPLAEVRYMPEPDARFEDRYAFPRLAVDVGMEFWDIALLDDESFIWVEERESRI